MFHKHGVPLKRKRTSGLASGPTLAVAEAKRQAQAVQPTSTGCGCINNGKALKRYEFGVRARIAMTGRSNFVVDDLALPGNPFDGHTLVSALDQVRRLTQSAIDEAFVDRGDLGHSDTDATV